MENEPVFEFWCTVATKLSIYKDKIVIGHFWGLNPTTIPMRQLASVSYGFTGFTFETTGGGKSHKLQPYKMPIPKCKEIVNTIIELINQAR